ncbi:MAG: tetratricopeptide repeat protein [Polyangiaceae bacterium]
MRARAFFGVVGGWCLIAACHQAAPPSAGTAPGAAKPVAADASGRCQGGDAGACKELGDAHRNGAAGTAKDPARAADFYAKACELSNGPSCDALAMMYYGGEGVAKDERKGDSLEDRACTLKHAPACFGLAYVLATDVNKIMAGQVQLPPEQQDKAVDDARNGALKYLKAACDLGNKCACLALQTGDCKQPDACSESGPDGSCLVKCAEEPGCQFGTFAVLGG